MAGVHIVVDGAAALPREAALNFGISIVPQTVASAGERWLVDGAKGAEAVCQALPDQSGAVHLLPPDPEAFRTAIAEILGWGVEAISLHAPATLSPAVEVALAAVEQLPKDAAVSVLTTEWAGTALGLLAIQAAHLGAEGASRAEIEAVVGSIGKGLHLLVVARNEIDLAAGSKSDVRDMASGASESGTVGANRSDADEVADCALWSLESAEFRCRARGLGMSEALRALVDAVRQELGTASGNGHAERPRALHMGLFSVDADAETAAVATYLERIYAPAELWLCPADPVLALRCGHGAFGVAFYQD